MPKEILRIADAESMDSLGYFADASFLCNALDIAGWQPDDLIRFLKSMLLIRYAEEKIAEMVEAGLVRCPCHLGIGQEAVAVGVSHSLRPSDRIFGAHRSHSHFLALGGSLDALLAETFGKVTGCSCGMGGSMHLYAHEIGFAGSVPIVAASIPIAVGAALAHKLAGTDNVAVSYFGDGATEEGVFHESLNLAAIQRLPVLFICENNLYASHLDIKLRQPSDNVSRYAIANRIRSLIVDGNDVVAVAEAAKQLTQYARSGEGPAFLEAITYRWRGHVGPREDLDVGVRRKPEDIQAWKMRDPVKRLVEPMIEAGFLNEAALKQMELSIREEVSRAAERGKSDPYPAAAALLNTVLIGG